MIIPLFSLICLRNYQKLSKKNSVVKKFAKIFQTCKKDVIFLLIFKLQKTFKFFKQIVKSVSIFFDRMRKVYHFFLTKCEKSFNFFDKMRKVFHFFLQMRKVFHFFRQNAKIVLIFYYKCEECFTFFDKMRKVFYFFYKVRKVVEFFLTRCKNYQVFFTCVQFFYCFSEYVCKNYSIFLTYVRVRSTKLSSNCFSMIYPEPLIRTRHDQKFPPSFAFLQVGSL